MGACVYGVTAAAALPKITAGGIEGRPVTAVENGPLAALVSEEPPGPLKASRRNLMAHSGVLQEAIAAGCVLPMRFGVVMPSEEAVRDELLRDHEQELVAQLEAFDELVELDLKIVCPEEVLVRTIAADRPDIAALSVQIRGRPPEATYYERITLGELVAEAATEKRQVLERLVVERIAPLAERVDMGEPAHDQMLLNVAFLVERARVDEVDEAVQAVNGELGPGLRLTYVGPLPAYRFVESEAAAWA